MTAPAELRRWSDRPPVVGGVAALAAALVVLAPWLQPGALLVRDLAVVPDPGWSALLLTPPGLPREVPGDALVALVGQVLPAGLVVRLALLGALSALGAGAGRLAGSRGAAAVAGVAVVWNPYVLARLQQGQWLVVVALAAVPWVVVHLVERDVPRLVRTLVLASVAGFLAVVVVVPTFVAGAVVLRRWRALAVGTVAVVVAALPWLVVSDSVAVDPDGFTAFAPSADLAFGTLPSLLAGGGHFNVAVASPWRGNVVVAALALALVAVAVVGVWRWDGGGGGPRRVLVVSSVLGLAAAATASTALGRQVMAALAEALPVLAALRDAHRLVAPWVVLLAVGIGIAVAALGRRASLPSGAAVLGVLLVVVTLPDPLLGPRLPGPVELPGSWRQAASAIEAESPRAVLVVPHGRTQRYAFTDGRPVHVPLQRLIGAPVLVDDRLVVEAQDGAPLVVDERQGGAVHRDLAAAWPVDGTELAAADVGWVTVTDPELMVTDPPAGTEVVVSSPSLQLVRVTEGAAVVSVARGVVVLDLLVALLAVVIMVAPSRWARRARPRHPAHPEQVTG